MIEWTHGQRLEQRWWGNCANTLTEEMKQGVYAQWMGLRWFHSNGRYHIPMEGKRVADIGGGPVSLLLKCSNVRGTVVDPFCYPPWVVHRYNAAGITIDRTRAEDFHGTGFDEVWMYNLLEHVDCVETVIRNARRAGRVLRVFDWLHTPLRGPHRHSLDRETLDRVFGAAGTVKNLAKDDCRGHPSTDDDPGALEAPDCQGRLVYYGVFNQEVTESR